MSKFYYLKPRSNLTILLILLFFPLLPLRKDLKIASALATEGELVEGTPDLPPPCGAALTPIESGFNEPSQPQQLGGPGGGIPLLPIDQRPLNIDEINFNLLGDPDNQRKGVLVLIHGMDSAWQTFTPILRELSQQYYVVVYDQRGHGMSHEGGRLFHSSLLAQDLLTLLDHLKLWKIHLLGHSMGARTAVQFAALHPERVQSLVIEDMDMSLRVDPSPETDQHYIQVADQLNLLPRHYPHRTDLIAQLEPVYGQKRAEYIARRRTKTDETGVHLLFRPAVGVLYGYQGNAESLLGAYRSLTMPLMIMRAKPEKTVISEEGLKQMMQVKPPGPDVSYLSFDSAEHNIHGSEAQVFTRELLAFLKRVSPIKKRH